MQRLTKISGTTKVCGLFGDPVAHSFSPAMHNAAFSVLGLDYVYVPFLVAPGDLEAAVRAIRALNLAGVNVTVPHKEKILPLLDGLTPEAAAAGAVNTIVPAQGKLIGDNTDGAGFLRALKLSAGFAPEGKRVLVLGAGGAARAVSAALARAGAAEIWIAARNDARAAALARALFAVGPSGARGNGGAPRLLPVAGSGAGPGRGPEPKPAPEPGGTGPECGPVRAAAVFWGEKELKELLPQVQLIVQATPVGMSPRWEDCPPFPFDCLRPGHVVCDLIYNPPLTKFLARAKEAGAGILNGLGMLLYQGALAFELWTGVSAPVEVMRRALEEEMARFSGSKGAGP